MESVELATSTRPGGQCLFGALWALVIALAAGGCAADPQDYLEVPQEELEEDICKNAPFVPMPHTPSFTAI